MKSFMKIFSFTALVGLTAACFAADRKEKKRGSAFDTKGDAEAPSAVVVKGKLLLPGETYTGGLRRILTTKRLAACIRFWWS